MNIDELRRKILDSQSLPFTHKALNVRKFLQENEEFFDKLLYQMQENIQKQGGTISKGVKSKSVSKFSVPRNRYSNITSYQQLKQRNSFLQQQLKTLRRQESERQMQDNPRLKDLRLQIQLISKQVQVKSQINKQLKDVIEDRSDMFEMYEKMCRKCQVIRKVNNQISEQIVTSIKKLNELTGRDENPNLFIMHFK